MAKRKYARDPMLYIQQPDNKNPRASMQHSYRTKKIPSGINGGGVYTRNRKFFDEEKEARQNEENIELEEVEIKETEEAAENEPMIHQQEDQKRKKFNDRTLEEKINYFADAPAYAPNKKCEIKTEHKSYRGIIINRDEQHVFMQVGNRSKAIKILIEEIKNIRLLGFL